MNLSARKHNSQAKTLSLVIGTSVDVDNVGVTDDHSVTVAEADLDVFARNVLKVNCSSSCWPGGKKKQSFDNPGSEGY